MVPTHDYWTATNLGFSGTSGACFGSTGGTSCSNGTTAEPMRVCTVTGTDAEGNTCKWTHCGINTVKPDDYIGGCSNNMYAGSLCCGNN